jgi:quercetin dioxygenase-like cupin family protein
VHQRLARNEHAAVLARCPFLEARAQHKIRCTGLIHFLIKFVRVMVSRRSLTSFFDHLNGSAVTNNPSPSVKSYSVHEDELKWFDVPLVAGGKAALLYGDPTKAGTVVLRFRFPPNRQTLPHRHPYAEYTTILSGKVYYGEGETFDTSNPQIGRAGTFAIVPAGQAHFVWALDEEAIVQLQFEGPSSTTFVDPANEGQRK